MHQPPKPDVGFGAINTIRVFSLESVEWHAFEYVCPFPPAERSLIVLNRHAYFSASEYPAEWRTMPAADLIASLEHARANASEPLCP
jgi:hypothetical protein